MLHAKCSLTSRVSSPLAQPSCIPLVQTSRRLSQVRKLITSSNIGPCIICIMSPNMDMSRCDPTIIIGGVSPHHHLETRTRTNVPMHHITHVVNKERKVVGWYGWFARCQQSPRYLVHDFQSRIMTESDPTQLPPETSNMAGTYFRELILHTLVV